MHALQVKFVAGSDVCVLGTIDREVLQVSKPLMHAEHVAVLAGMPCDTERASDKMIAKPIQHGMHCSTA